MKPSILFKGSYLLLITEIRNLDPAVRRIIRLVSETQGLGVPLSKVGFPIRKFTDQSFFAAPRDLSQRSTSFIASQRQGIRRMPLSTLDRSYHQCPSRSAAGRTHFFGQSFVLHPRLRGENMTERPALLLRIAPTAAQSASSSRTRRHMNQKRKAPLTNCHAVSRRFSCENQRTMTCQDVGCRKLLRQHMYMRA